MYSLHKGVCFLRENKRESIKNPLYLFLLISLYNINPIKTMQTITSPNIITAPAPTADTTSTTTAINIIAINSNIMNNNIFIPPFIKEYVKIANKS